MSGGKVTLMSIMNRSVTIFTRNVNLSLADGSVCDFKMQRAIRNFPEQFRLSTSKPDLPTAFRQFVEKGCPTLRIEMRSDFIEQQYWPTVAPLGD